MNKPLTLREHQNIMLKMMIEFDEFCKKNDLRYYIAYGTLLGAVRHKGFIPWDDDVDFVMPRPDYEKLLKFDEISTETQVVSYRNSQNYYHPFCASVLTDKNTIMKESLIKRQTGKGVFCDIFPLDGLPNDKKELDRHLKTLTFLEGILCCGTNNSPGFTNLKDTLKTIIGFLLKRKDLAQITKRIDEIAQVYSYDECDKIVHSVSLFNNPDRFIANKSDYEDYIFLEFEGYKFRAPIGYENILEQAYGDYMKLPPESERKGHHGIEIYLRNK